VPADAEIDEMYALPLGEFVAARNALAKNLRANGDREEAARVAALRKPAAGAWVVNQLARSAPEDVRALLAAGRKLAEAQAGALRGSGSAPLREAAATERAAVRRLLEHARPLVRTDQQLNRVAEILRAAAADTDVGDLVAAGRLTDEPEPTGFGLLVGGVGTDSAEIDEDEEDTDAEREAARRRRERERAELIRVAERAEREAERLEQRAEAAEGAATERRAAADLAREEAEERRAAADQSNSLP
jgi:hypothetical protein